MLKLNSIICCVTILCLLNKPTRLNAQSSLDTVFVSWNKFTFKSLKRQTQSTIDSVQKAMYENRLLSVKEYWDIKNIDDFNSTSIRYKLLKTAVAKSNKDKNFYIIEANESGSKVLLRSIVLCISSASTVDADFYNFFNGEWKMTGKQKGVDFYLQGDFKNYISRFGKGFNSDDIIITEFKNGRVQESEYYLYSTLSAESKIKSVLDGYRKENFIK